MIPRMDLFSDRMKPLLQVENLNVSFQTRKGRVYAVNGVSFQLYPGEILGIVGESGSGKSVTCYSLMGLIPNPPGRIDSGSALFEETDLLQCSSRVLRKIRGHHISMIFQDPMTSLNPYMRIGPQLIEPLRIHLKTPRQEAQQQAIRALNSVGIPEASLRLRQFPHELSGGMRQRVMMAMALITEPELLIADEPTTALDVTVQAQILELIRHRKEKTGASVLLITHDLGVVAEVCDRVVVMYAGRILETGSTRDIFKSPRHPYTSALQRSLPGRHRKGELLKTIPGMPPDLLEPLCGCPFADRCDYRVPECSEIDGELILESSDCGTACPRVHRGEISLNEVKQGGDSSL
ncbi:MAG TPA: ABC transporter ATP-binding protein [Verrucomicrobiales bacterium]|nr:ABC transporter ATP-binding protein [Verrucomicrobiales bacterium]